DPAGRCPLRGRRGASWAVRVIAGLRDQTGPPGSALRSESPSKARGRRGTRRTLGMRISTARGLGAACAVVTLSMSPGAWATTAEDLCGLPIPDPCVVQTEQDITDGSIIDLGGAGLVLRTLNGRLDVGPGTMTIIARSVRLETGAKLLGAGGTIIVAA